MIQTHAEHVARTEGEIGVRERAWTVARDAWRTLREEGSVELFGGFVFGGLELRPVRVSKSEHAGAFIVEGSAWRAFVRPRRGKRGKRARWRRTGHFVDGRASAPETE